MKSLANTNGVLKNHHATFMLLEVSGTVKVKVLKPLGCIELLLVLMFVASRFTMLMKIPLITERRICKLWMLRLIRCLPIRQVWVDGCEKELWKMENIKLIEGYENG